MGEQVYSFLIRPGTLVSPGEVRTAHFSFPLSEYSSNAISAGTDPVHTGRLLF
jgi:hypothetical protein